MKYFGIRKQENEKEEYSWYDELNFSNIVVVHEDDLKVKEFKDAHPVEGEREFMLFNTINKLSNF